MCWFVQVNVRVSVRAANFQLQRHRHRCLRTCTFQFHGYVCVYVYMCTLRRARKLARLGAINVGTIIHICVHINTMNT